MSPEAYPQRTRAREIAAMRNQAARLGLRWIAGEARATAIWSV